jgi:hypothetical protein
MSSGGSFSRVWAFGTLSFGSTELTPTLGLLASLMLSEVCRWLWWLWKEEYLGEGVVQVCLVKIHSLARIGNGREQSRAQ